MIVLHWICAVLYLHCLALSCLVVSCRLVQSFSFLNLSYVSYHRIVFHRFLWCRTYRILCCPSHHRPASRLFWSGHSWSSLVFRVLFFGYSACWFLLPSHTSVFGRVLWLSCDCMVFFCCVLSSINFSCCVVLPCLEFCLVVCLALRYVVVSCYILSCLFPSRLVSCALCLEIFSTSEALWYAIVCLSMSLYLSLT